MVFDKLKKRLPNEEHVEIKVKITLKSISPLNKIVQLLEPAPPGEQP